MNKAYIIWPLIGLLVFGVFYWNFDRGYKGREHLKAVQEEQVKQDRIRLDLERRKKAIEDATKAQEERRALRLAKEKKDQEEADARNALVERRMHAYDEVNRHLAPQLDRQKVDADSVKGEIAQLELQKKQYEDDEAFLRTYTRQAERNVTKYYDLLEKLKAAEDARAAAEAAAKAVKKD
jgi:hypothetical protein